MNKLISRTSQQCLSDLSDVIDELAKIDIPQEESVGTPSHGLNHVNGAAPGNSSKANVQKKLRILEFAQEKRAQFIKLLVISQWSRQAAAVQKAIDIHAWMVSQFNLYHDAIEAVGEMKRGLSGAKIPPPDLDTAIEVLSTGKVSRLPTVCSSL